MRGSLSQIYLYAAGKVVVFQVHLESIRDGRPGALIASGSPTELHCLLVLRELVEHYFLSRHLQLQRRTSFVELHIVVLTGAQCEDAQANEHQIIIECFHNYRINKNFIRQKFSYIRQKLSFLRQK